MLKIIFDVNLFKTGVFPCILVLGFMMVSGGDCVLIMLPPHAKDIGLSNNQRGILMLLFACCDLLSRIILTIIGDRPFIKRTTLLVFAASILGLSCHLLVFFKTFGAMVVFSIITGTGLYNYEYILLIVFNTKPCKSHLKLVIDLEKAALKSLPYIIHCAEYIFFWFFGISKGIQSVQNTFV